MARFGRDLLVCSVGIGIVLTALFVADYVGVRCTRSPIAEVDPLAQRRQALNRTSIWMGDIEVELVLRHMSNVSTYLEWGCGGSTKNFAKFATKRAVSIEHDKRWCGMMKKALAQLKSNVELRCVEVRAGTKGWRGGFYEGNYLQFRPYIDEIAKLNQSTWDFILIDGRSRVDAAIKALSYITSKSVVVLHDAERFSRRWQYRYKPVLDYYDIVDRTGGPGRQGIAVLRRKRSLQRLEGNHSAVQNILNAKYSLKS